MFPENCLRSRKKTFACFGENYSSRRAHEQLRAHFGFQLSYLHADRGLGDVNASCRRGKGAQFGNRQKGFQLSNFHHVTIVTEAYRIDKIF